MTALRKGLERVAEPAQTRHFFPKSPNSRNKHVVLPISGGSPHLISSVMGKIGILGEFWQFLKIRKKFWLAPILVVLLLLSLVIVLAQGSALAPFIYALF